MINLKVMLTFLLVSILGISTTQAQDCKSKILEFIDTQPTMSYDKRRIPRRVKNHMSICGKKVKLLNPNEKMTMRKRIKLVYFLEKDRRIFVVFRDVSGYAIKVYGIFFDEKKQCVVILSGGKVEKVALLKDTLMYNELVKEDDCL